MVVSQCFVAIQLVTEEKLAKKYQLDPLYLVGMEGVWGCAFMAVILPTLQHLEIEDSLTAI